ncbi:MAG: hypothetical protein ABIO45_13090 [Burkholderiaceae bacterium]
MLGDTVAQTELEHGHTIPNGTYLDIASKLPLVEPQQIRCPPLPMRAERDGIATENDVMAFFARLPMLTSSMCVPADWPIPRCSASTGRRLHHARQAFPTLPASIDIGERSTDFRGAPHDRTDAGNEERRPARRRAEWKRWTEKRVFVRAPAGAAGRR